MKNLEAVSIISPGYFGLNTQESSVSLPTNYSLVADNCVIDKYGRLGARKGWTQQTTDGVTELSGQTIKFMLEHVNADNTVTVISGGNEKILTGGVGAALTDITPATYTITGDNWSGATLNDYAMLVQAGHEPLIYNDGTLEAYTDFTADSPSFGSNTLTHVVAAYGRFWATDGKFIYWSTDIADVNFPQFNGGTSGFLNIASVLPNNVDTVSALAVHNNLLIMFCEHNIVIYKGAEDVLSTDFALQDIIPNVGCIARDSVQSTGADIMFLSASGVRSLGRVIQEKSLPMRELTKNIRDDLVQYIENETSMDDIKGVYSEKEAFYLLTFPSRNVIMYIDTRKALDDGSGRCTFWTGFPSGALLRRRNGDLLIGKANGIGKYEGYKDNTSNYRIRYRSAYIDLQNSVQTKMLKRAAIVVVGGNGQEFIVTVNYDYLGNDRQYSFTIDSGVTYEWGSAEWGLAEYSSGISIERVNSPTDGSGKTFQIGFDAEINGNQLSVQRLDVFVKTGRIN
jgi:hypothetical protein